MRGSYGGFRVSSRGRLWTDIGNWVFFFLLQRLGERRGFEVLNCKERLGFLYFLQRLEKREDLQFLVAESERERESAENRRGERERVGFWHS